ncbi:MAG: hypothetical protein H8E44_09910 [Planctomycetes bacterium]|nr:hypothetical protein [Planctomycetota bacterium]
MNWKTMVIGGLLASAVGVAIVAFGTQPFEGSDYRGVLTTMAVLCYLGCLPALLVPLLWMAHRRRPDRKPFVKAAALAGTIFPFAITTIVFMAPWLLTLVGLTDAAREFQDGGGRRFRGELDLDDASTWLVLVPAAVFAGTLISHLVLRPFRGATLQRDCSSGDE